MTKEEMRNELRVILSAEDPPLDVPTPSDWQGLEARFGTVFPPDFKSFVDLMAEFSFPGEIYNVTRSERTNGNDLIETVNDAETPAGWPRQLVPFYGIGNGDYFALNADEGEKTGVYFRYHEDGRIDRYSESFEEWVKRLPAFLRGEG